MSTQHELPDNDAGVATQALDWLLRNQDGPLPEGERALFLTWLQRSPEHVRQYLHALQLHREVGKVVAAPVDATRPANVILPRTLRQADNVVQLFAPAGSVAGGRKSAGAATARPRRWRMLAAVASVAMLAVVGLSSLWPAEQQFSAGHGQVRELQLPDQTRLRLNADSEVRVRMGWFRREVELLRGEATFDVGVDRRPFRVRVDGLDIRDIGTVFDVARRLQDTRVGVVSGEVEVWSTGQQQRRLAGLNAGDVVLVERGSQRLRHLDVAADRLLDWQQGKVSFSDERLDEVAAAFNRHNAVQVIIDDETAAAARLSGSLDADRIAALQVFLARDPRFMVRREGDQIHVSSR